MDELRFSGPVPEGIDREGEEIRNLRSRLSKTPLDAFVATDLPSLLRTVGVGILGDPSEGDLVKIKQKIEVHERKQKRNTPRTPSEIPVQKPR